MKTDVYGRTDFVQLNMHFRTVILKVAHIAPPPVNPLPQTFRAREGPGVGGCVVTETRETGSHRTVFSKLSFLDHAPPLRLKDSDATQSNKMNKVIKCTLTQ